MTTAPTTEPRRDSDTVHGLVRGCYAVRRDGKHWCSLVPDCESHKLVRVCAGPGEALPSDVCWHFALPVGTLVPSDRVWLHYGYFPCAERSDEWRRATDAEVAKQEADEKAGPFVFTGANGEISGQRAAGGSNAKG